LLGRSLLPVVVGKPVDR